MMSPHFFYEPKNVFCLELLFLTMFPKGMRAIGKCRQTVRNKCKSKLAWAKLTKIRSFNGLSSSSNVGLTYTQISFAHYVIKTTKDTWPHLLPLYKNKVLNALQIARHNVAIHLITHLLQSCTHTRHYTLTHASTKHNTSHDNTTQP